MPWFIPTEYLLHINRDIQEGYTVYSTISNPLSKNPLNNYKFSEPYIS